MIKSHYHRTRKEEKEKREHFILQHNALSLARGAEIMI